MEMLLQHWRDAYFKGMSLCLSPAQISFPPSTASVFLHCSIFKAPFFVSLSHDHICYLSRVITFPLCWFASAIEFSLYCSLCRLGWKPTEDNWNFLTDCWKTLLKGRNIKDNKTYLRFLPVDWGRVKWLLFMFPTGFSFSDFIKPEQTISAPFLKDKDVQIPGESTKWSFEEAHLLRSNPSHLTLNVENNLRRMQVAVKMANFCYQKARLSVETSHLSHRKRDCYLWQMSHPTHFRHCT